MSVDIWGIYDIQLLFHSTSQKISHDNNRTRARFSKLAEEDMHPDEAIRLQHLER